MQSLSEMTKEVIESAQFIKSFLGDEEHGHVKALALSSAIELKVMQLGEKAAADKAKQPA